MAQPTHTRGRAKSPNRHCSLSEAGKISSRTSPKKAPTVRNTNCPKARRRRRYGATAGKTAASSAAAASPMAPPAIIQHTTIPM